MTTAPTSITSLVTKIQCESGIAPVDSTVPWLIDMLMTGAQFPGFWSGEIIAPARGDCPEWTLIQRFRTEADTKAWENSDQCLSRIKAFPVDASNGPAKISRDLILENEQGSVATAIVTDVRPGMEAAYAKWEVKIQNAQARFPGYRGSYLQLPSDPENHHWTTLLRFDSAESLDRWFVSEERARLLPEAEKFVKSTGYKRLSSSFSGWVEEDASGESPANWKIALLVLLGLFPVVILDINFLSPHFSGMVPALAHMISMVLSVTWVTYGAMPLFNRTFRWWLLPSKEDYVRQSALGLLIVVCLLSLEVLALYHLPF